MNPITDLCGIVTVLNTPYTRTNEVDLSSVEGHVRYALAAGVNGFLVPAMAAEVTKLELPEREAMLSTVIRTVSGRVPVVAGVYAPDSAARVAIAARYVELGADAVLVSIPFVSEEAYTREVGAVASLGMQVLMIQDWAPDGYGIPLDTIVRLTAEVPNFRSIKIEVAASGMKYTDVLERTNRSLHVAGGWAVGQMIEGLDRGIHAFMPTALHEIYVEIYRRYRSGDREGARALHFDLLPILSFTNQHLDISIHFFKQLLHRQGVFATPLVREPILPFDRYHQRQADYLLERAIELIGRVKG